MTSEHHSMLCSRCARRMDTLIDTVEPSPPAWTIRQYTHMVQNLRTIRESLGITQKELASDVQAHQSHVVKWERWGTEPGVANMQRIATALHAAGYEPPSNPGGWTLECVLHEIHTSTPETHPQMFLKLGVNDQTVRQWRRGATPQLDVLLRIEEVYGNPEVAP